VPTPDVRARLAALDAHAGPAVHRFDADLDLDARTVVLPSAFNPPTRAHVALLAAAAEVAGAASRAALLSTRNVDKGLYGATLDHRVGMLLAAAAEHALAVLTTNAARFVDQALALRTAFPGASFDFIAGYDTLVRIFDERYYDDMAAELAPFFASHRLVAANRGPYGPDDVERFIDRHPLAAAYHERIIIAPIDAESAALSSTLAREVASRGADLDAVPPSVAGYILANGLYRPGNLEEPSAATQPHPANGQ
jgi:nicotinamide-nucleotide adenylyltransferase